MQKRIGLLILLIGATSCSGGASHTTSANPASLDTPQSVSGAMIPFSANTAWTYQTINASSPYTITLHANTNNAASSGALSAFVAPGLQHDGFSSSPATAIADSAFVDPTAGSFRVNSIVRTRNGPVPIPGSPELAPATLSMGQSFTPYPGVTASVIAVGTMRGASLCSSSRGATVEYRFQSDTYRVSYVPNCGITDFITNTGVELQLVSISQNADPNVASAERSVSGTTLLDTIRDVTNAIFRR